MKDDTDATLTEIRHLLREIRDELKAMNRSERGTVRTSGREFGLVLGNQDGATISAHIGR